VGNIATGSGGESVFSEGRSLVFKSLRVTRLYDAPKRTLVYLAHASELTQGSGKMAISTIQLPPGVEP
jgi:CreA protein